MGTFMGAAAGNRGAVYNDTGVGLTKWAFKYKTRECADSERSRKWEGKGECRKRNRPKKFAPPSQFCF